MIAWSHTRLKDFELCRQMFYAKYIAKSVEFIPNEATKRGTDVHKALERAAIRIKFKNPPEPNEHTAVAMPMLQSFAASNNRLFIEEKLAFKEDLTPCAWFSKKAWFRVMVDIYGREGRPSTIQDQIFTALDWKTGKVRITGKDLDQLNITNLGILLNHSKAVEVSSALVFLDHKRTSPIVRTKRTKLAELIEVFSERVEAIQIAEERDLWPTTKNYLCSWCQVSTCRHAGG